MFHHWKALLDLPRAAWVVAGAQLINRAGTMVVPFLALFLTQERHQSAGEASRTLAAFGVGALVGSPLSGRLMDRVAPVLLMRFSLVGSGLVALVLPHLVNAWAFTAGIFVFSVLNELFRPANMTLLSGLAPPERRKQVFALHRLAVNLGMSVGPLVGGLLAERWFDGVFLVDGVTSVVAGLFLWRGLSVKGEAPAVSGNSAAGPSVLRDARMMFLLLGMWMVDLVFMQLEGPSSVFLVKHAGLTPSSFGALYIINTLLIVVLEVPLNGATAHWSSRRTLGLGGFLIAVGMPMVGLTPWLGWPAAVAAMVVATFGEMILFPGASALVADWAPEASRGRYMGAFTLTFALGFTVGPPMGTYVLGAVGPAQLWLGALAVGLLGTLVLVRLPGHRAV